MPLPPPAEYAHPYEGRLTVYRVPLAEISAACRNIPRVLGCAYWDRQALSYCRVYVPNDLPANAEAAILAHELGHCNGWQHWQPEAPEVKMEIDRGTAVKRALTNPLCETEPKPEACP
jgi:hypothetical protein